MTADPCGSVFYLRRYLLAPIGVAALIEVSDTERAHRRFESAAPRRAGSTGTMPIYITQGRYTREAIKGMTVKPEDRTEALSRHVARAGGRVIGYYLTLCEYDFPTIIEAPREIPMSRSLAVAPHAGG